MEKAPKKKIKSKNKKVTVGRNYLCKEKQSIV